MERKDTDYESIGKIITLYREGLGHDINNMASFLSKYWEVNKHEAKTWVINLENGNILDRLTSEIYYPGFPKREVSMQRIADYFNALSFPEDLRKQVIGKLEGIIKKFELPDSKVEVFDKSKIARPLSYPNIRDRLLSVLRRDRKVLDDIDAILKKYEENGHS